MCIKQGMLINNIMHVRYTILPIIARVKFGLYSRFNKKKIIIKGEYCNYVLRYLTNSRRMLPTMRVYKNSKKKIIYFSYIRPGCIVRQ